MPLDQSYSPARVSRLGLCIFLVALGVRLAWVVPVIDRVPGGQTGTLADETDYEQRAIMEWKQDPSLWPEQTFLAPGYPYFLAAVYRIAGHRPDVVRLVQVVISAITSVLLYGIGLELYGKSQWKIAAVGSAAYAFWYPDFSLVGLYATETLFVFLVVCAFWLLMRAQRLDRHLLFLMAGLLLGGAALTRAVVLLLPMFLFLGLWLSVGSLVGAIRRSLLIGAGMMLIILPYTFRNYRTSGQFIPVALGSGTMLFRGSCEQQTVWNFDTGECWASDARHQIAEGTEIVTVQGDAHLRQAAIEKIMSMPWFYIGQVIHRTLGYWIQPMASGAGSAQVPWLRILLYLGQIVLVILVLVGAWHTRERFPAVLLIDWCIYLTAMLVPFVAVRRYRLPMEGFWLILAAGGLWILWQRIHSVAIAPKKHPQVD